MAIRREGRSHPVVDRALIIGRRDDPETLVVRDGRVSRWHARVEPTDAGATVRDLGSTNRTWIRRGDVLIDVGQAPVALVVGDAIVTIDELLLGTVEARDEAP